MRDPLTERDYLEIRTAVMSRIRRRELPMWKLALVPVAIAIALLFMPSREVSYDIRPIPRATLVQAVVQQQPVVVPVAQHKRHPIKKHKEVVQTASTEVTRIDIQTADPDVRIIWFARQEDSK